MPLTFTTGNIWTMDGIPVIPVNCVGVMGAGLALQCKQRYPKVFEMYRNHCDANTFGPGDVHAYIKSPFNKYERSIIVMATKDDYRNPSKQQWIEHGLINLKFLLEADVKPTDIILLPPIGCGLGRLQWSVIKPLVIKHLKDVPNPIHVLEPTSNKVTNMMKQ